MKRHSTHRIAGLLAACLISAVAVYGREGNPAAYRDDDRLCIKLPITAGIDLPANGQLIVTPVVTDGEHLMQLPPVVFTGRIREKVNERRERLYGTPALPENSVSNTVIRRGRKNPSENTVLFEKKIPYEPWMAGGRVVLYRDLEGCAGHRTALPPLVAAEIPASVQPQLSFLVPADEPKRRSEQITAVVHFPQGRSVLLRGFADNRRQLARIDSLTACLTTNDTLRIESIYLKGYASPEDTYAFNTRLSANRARAIRSYLQENFRLEDAEFTVVTEPEDWDSLRRWVVLSDLPARDEVLAVIDTVSDPDARDAGIWKTDNGKTYLMLLREVYPQLRRVDYRIGYTLPPFTVEQCRELIGSRPEWMTLGEMCRLAETYAVDSPERAYVCAVALEFYPDDPCACNNMAALALRCGDIQTARQCLARCAEAPYAWNNLGILCLIDGDTRKAQHCFSLAAEGGSAEAAYNLAHFAELNCEW